MRRWPRRGDLVLVCAIAVLAAAACNSLLAAGRERDAGLATFARDAALRPGVLSDAQFRRAYRVAAVCALHRPAVGAPVDYKLCGVLGSVDGYQYVRRWYRCTLATRCAPPARLNLKRQM